MPTNDINARAMLVTLNISTWTAARGDKEAAKAANRATGTSEKFKSGRDTGRFTRFLIDTQALEAGDSIAGSARSRHKKLTAPYSDDSTRIIGGVGYAKYMEMMESSQTEYLSWYTDIFKPSYPGLVKEAKEIRGEDFRAAQYPDIHQIDLERGRWIGPSPQLDRKFSFTITPGAVPDANHLSKIIGVSPEDMARIQRDALNGANARLERAVNDVWERFSAVVEHMVERLKVYGQKDGESGKKQFFTDTLVTNISDLVEIIPILNVTGNPEITAMAKRVTEELTHYSPEVLRQSASYRAQVTKAAENIMTSIRGTRRILSQAA